MKIENGVLKEVTNKDIIKGTCIVPDNVISIGWNAFSEHKNLTNVVIPDSVTSIGEWAFSYCASLTSITIPDSVTSIGPYAFSGCTGLTSIILGSGVRSIDRFAFFRCTKLTNITVPDNLVSIGPGAFDGCRNLVAKIANYKAFCYDNHSLVCRNKKHYYINKRSWAKGKLKLCENGIHFCTNLFDIFSYYWGVYKTEFVIALCDVSDEQDATGAENSKRCARWVRPTHILTHEELVALLNNPIKGGEK